MVTVLGSVKLKRIEPSKPLIERAFELARSGTCTQVEDIEKILGQEGYPKSSPHWNSGSFRKQLRRACQQARGAEIAAAGTSDRETLDAGTMPQPLAAS